MSRARTERLLNLTIALLATRRYLTRAEIRDAVPGYSSSDEAFERAFERDKEDLREMGVPLETGSSSALFDDEVGYRIRRERYAMPEVHVTREEMAILTLAATAWSDAALAAPAARALRKLSANNPDPPRLPAVVVPRIETRDPAFWPLYAAVRDARPVRFPYLPTGATESAMRTVEPWGLLAWHGHWYLVGYDRDREASRVFRLSRIAGPVKAFEPPGSVQRPAGVDLRTLLEQSTPAPVVGTATVRVRRGAGGELRRLARGWPQPATTSHHPAAPTSAPVTTAVLHPGPAVAEARTATVDPTDGRSRDDDQDEDELTVPYTDLRALAEEVAALGPDAFVVAPAELREQVVARLRGAMTSGR